MNPTRPSPKVWHARRNVETTKWVSITREGIGAFAFDHHLSRSVHRIGAQCEFKFVVVVQSESDRIKTRTKIGAGSRNTHAYFASNWSHISSSFVTSSLQVKHRIPEKVQESNSNP